MRGTLLTLFFSGPYPCVCFTSCAAVPPTPVCVSLQEGVGTTGVSVAFTVLACDAGPIFLQEQVAVPEDEQAPQLLERLFKHGAQLLISNIDRVWTGEAAEVAWQQDHAQATHAAKVSAPQYCLLQLVLEGIPPISSLRCSLHRPGCLHRLLAAHPPAAHCVMHELLVLLWLLCRVSHADHKRGVAARLQQASSSATQPGQGLCWLARRFCNLSSQQQRRRRQFATAAARAAGEDP